MSAVSLQFLGTGDAFAARGRSQACLHLRGGEETMLLDCGATGLAAIKGARLDPAEIGWLVLSHLHGDHFAGVVFLILDGQYSGRERPLMIAGPPGTQDRIEQALEVMYPGSSKAERPFEVRFTALEPRTPCDLGPAVVTPFEVQHGGGAPAYALRLQYAGRVIGYSGDTEWAEELPAVAEDADLFVCECNFFDQQVPGHLNYRTLIARREQLRSKRIVLTHLSEEMLAHAEEVDLQMAFDGLTIEL